MKVRNLFRTMLGRAADDLDASYVSSSRHIVLGGCGRSGTTLARVILDSHPSICCGPESKLLLDEPLDAARLAARFKFDRDQVLQARDDSASRGEFIDRFASMCCASAGKQRWAEKTPRNVLHLRWIFDHFPQTRFVHLLRDGRDVACSLRTHPRHKVVNGRLVPLNTWRPMEECAGRWRDSLAAVQPFLADARVHTVRYEDLVAQPELTTKRLFEFVGEPWDPRVLAHADADSRFRDATTFPQNPEALRPIDRSAMHRWERDMTTDDRGIFKQIAGDLLVEYGYATGQDW
jgi:hypothetical protein